MSRTLSMSGRTLILCGVIAGTAILVNGLTVAYAEMERATVVRDGQMLDGLLRQTGGLERAIADEALAFDDYLLLGSAVDVGRYHDAAATEQELTLAMSGQADDLPGVGAALAAVAGATDAWRATIVTPALTSPTARQGASAAGSGVAAAMMRNVDRALAELAGQFALAKDDLLRQDAWMTTTRVGSAIFQVITGMVATLIALFFIRRFGRSLARDAQRGSVISRFTESTAFAHDETVIAASNLEALGLLAQPDASVTHILNRSQDRAVPEATRGDAIAEILTLKALGNCPGIFRGSTYVTEDASLPLSVRCSVYPVETGTLACVPLISGESVGAVHLYWARPCSLPLEMVADVNRIAQHAALAIGNRRLLAALQGQASTDARTGLPNSRAFDVVLEAELQNLHSGGSLAVLMVDVDHFKDFNDRHGHPAGDEALRVFAGVLGSSVRDNDVAARYGGEEFTVLLRGLDLEGALVVAERIRSRTESTLIALGPGITDRITVSIGVACAPQHGMDRIALLRAADEALYTAKESGRNRVVHLGQESPPVPTVLLAGAAA